MNQQKQDEVLGVAGENFAQDKLSAYFNVKLLKTNSHAIFDFISSDKKHVFEVKTRRCLSTHFSHTIVGMNKIEFAREYSTNADFYFVFNFPDKLMYIKYSDAFSQYKVNLNGRRDRGRDEIKDYIHIDVKHLITIVDKRAAPINSEGKALSE